MSPQDPLDENNLHKSPSPDVSLGDGSDLSFSGDTLQTAKRKLIQALKTFDIDTPDLDARLLLQRATQLSHVELVTESRTTLTELQAFALAGLLARRVNREPIDHILGRREFYGRDFIVNSHVLSPRPETEGLVAQGIEDLRGIEHPKILDLGTGSGAIVLSLLKECPDATAVATDLSEEALAVATANATALGVSDRIEFLQGSWFEPLKAGMSFDLIVSNPPYITEAAMAELSREVSEFDPHLALCGGEDGIGPYRIIARAASDYLNSGGALRLEIGFDQAEAVSSLLLKSVYTEIRVKQDGAGHDRFVFAQKTL